jgi:hypothetical protein
MINYGVKTGIHSGKNDQGETRFQVIDYRDMSDVERTTGLICFFFFSRKEYKVWEILASLLQKHTRHGMITVFYSILFKASDSYELWEKFLDECT